MKTKEAKQILIQLLIDNLEGRKTKSVDFSHFCEEVVKLKNAGTITEEDIIDLQDGILTKVELIDLCSYLNVNKTTGLSYKEAVDLGHKIQFAALSYAQENHLDGHSAFINSMKPMEQGIDAIYNGTYDSAKLIVLKTLPAIENWNHKLGAEAWDKHLKS